MIPFPGMVLWPSEPPRTLAFPESKSTVPQVPVPNNTFGLPHKRLSGRRPVKAPRHQGKQKMHTPEA